MKIVQRLALVFCVSYLAQAIPVHDSMGMLEGQGKIDSGIRLSLDCLDDMAASQLGWSAENVEGIRSLLDKQLGESTPDWSGVWNHTMDAVYSTDEQLAEKFLAIEPDFSGVANAQDFCKKVKQAARGIRIERRARRTSLSKIQRRALDDTQEQGEGFPNLFFFHQAGE